MSPERWRNPSQSAEPPADIYAFAMVMTKCITGQLSLPTNGESGPRVDFRGESDYDMNWVVRIYAGERPELAPGTRDLDTYEPMILQCWSFYPMQRPSSAAVAEEHLERLK
eukprot:4077482-Amphidinium_carterae.1